MEKKKKVGAGTGVGAGTKPKLKSNTSLKDKGTTLMKKFLGPKVRAAGEKTKNFLRNVMGGEGSTVKEINKDYPAKKKVEEEKKKKKPKIELAPDGLLGGLRKRNEAVQSQLDELDK